MSYILIAVLVVIIPYLIHYYVKRRKLLERVKVFYGDQTVPIIGTPELFGSNSEEIVKYLSGLFERAGYTTYKFQVGLEIFISLCDPDTVETILSNNKEITKSIEYTFMQEWLGDGLLLSTGNKWKQRRKIITPAFHFKILEQFVKVFNDNGNIMIRQLSKHRGKTIDIYPFVNHYALDVICETAMGVSVNAQTDYNSAYVKAVHSMCKLTDKRMFSAWKRLPWLYIWSSDYKQYKKDLKILHDTTSNVIKARKEALKDQIEKVKSGEALEGYEDEFINKKKKIAFLDMLILSKLPNGKFLSNDDIREETDTFMFEGHDTTSSAIAFAFYELSRNPEVQQKLWEEITSIVGDDPNETITYEHLQDMKYMDLVIKETLRLYPSVPIIGRKLENDLKLPDGKVIPASCNLVVNPFNLGRNPRHFENVLKFDPDRFLPENTAGKNPYMSVPFSAGSRNCIGQKFAQLEMKSIISKTLLNYEFQRADEIDAKLRLKNELILKSESGMKVVIIERFTKKQLMNNNI